MFMNRSPNAPKKKLVTFSISEENIREIEELINTKKFPSKSEIVRQAITALHWDKVESIKPALYAENEAKRIALKEKGISEKQRLENMTDEEYAQEEFIDKLGGYAEITDSADGRILKVTHPNDPGFVYKILLVKIKDFTTDVIPLEWRNIIANKKQE